MRKNLIFKIYLSLIIFTLSITILSIILIQQKIIPSFENWQSGTLFLFIFAIVSFAFFPAIYLMRKVTKLYKKIKEIQGDSLCINNEKSLGDLKLVNIISIFDEIDKIGRKMRILQFENRILYDTALAIHTSASLQELLDIILARLTTHTNADFGLIFLLDGDELTLKSHSNISEKNIEKKSFRIGEGLVGWTVHKGEGMLTQNVKRDYRYIRCVDNTKAQITIPIKMYERVLGVLVLGSEKISYFTDSDFKLINTISGEIGLAINNARLTEKLKKENQNNQVLFELTKKITASVDLNKVAEIGVKTIAEVIGAQSCVLAVSDEESNSLKIIASYGIVEKNQQLLELNGTIEEAFHKKYPVGIKINDGYAYSIPLLSMKNCIGILHVHAENVLSKDEIELINSAVTPLSTALENALLYKNIENLALRDGLTNMYNYRYFQEVLDEYVKQAELYNAHLSLVMLDIDNFKQYNDTYGHPVGDLLLKKITDVMQNNLRPNDIIARYGGDEFSIILPNTDIKEASTIMERIKNTISAHEFKIEDEKEKTDEEALGESSFKDDNILRKSFKRWIADKWVLNKFKTMSKSFNITISVGICSLADVHYDKEALIKNADKASLESKQKGKNQVSIWKPLTTE
ncbi:diguanylate cyclase [Geosporobacter ferrireducens]|uniref:Diguanylate cyclase n=1 Tax=Geosporobacter ferrireducens TaxID=1424294 RepID=A0A1D8GDI5_9FIRM|nr:diguanylate cyclase [Geosporobacter ferrireducens]